MATRASRKPTNEPQQDAAKIDLSKELGVTQYRDTDYSLVVDILPTGIPQLDYILGGGFPFGRINEVYGAEGSGKSTVALQLIRIMQYLGAYSLLADVEGTADPTRAADLGVSLSGDANNDRVYLIEPERDRKTGLMKEPMTVEWLGKRLKEILPRLAETKEPILLIWDSAAQTPSINELESKDNGFGRQPGIKAKALTTFSSQIAPLIKDTNVCFIVVNQARDNFGNTFVGAPPESPGGRAFKHVASVRLLVAQSTKISDNITDAYGNAIESYVGHNVRFKTEKSKVSTPHQSAIAYLLSATGLNMEENIYRSANNTGQYNLMQSKGSRKVYVDLNGETVMNCYGKDVVPFLKENFDIAKEIFQREIMISFPEWYAPLDNKNLIIDNIPWYKGLRERYEEQKKEKAPKKEKDSKKPKNEGE